jgi:MFS family permease
VTTIQWVSTGYLLALGIAVPLSTRGLQRFGGKRLWMFSLAGFLIGSIGSSLAWNVGSLIGWRVVQGVGGGLMLPLIGGAILTHLSWRFMFWVNVPFCVVGLLLAWRYLASDAPAGPDAARPRLDLHGLFLVERGAVLLRGSRSTARCS